MRASNRVVAGAGRFSRHSAPRPSRHQALTPNSSAPPEATSPGRIVICAHCRSPNDGDQAGADGEHEDAAAHRHRAPHRGAVACGPGSRARCAASAAARAGRSPCAPRRAGSRRRRGAPGPRRRTTATRLPAGATTGRATSARPQPLTAPTRNHSGRDAVQQVAGVPGQLDDAGRQRRGRPAVARPTAMPAGPAPDGLHGPGEHLAERGREDQPEDHRHLRPAPACRAPKPRRDRAEQDPGLDHPGDVERGQEQGAEVVGGRADRVGTGLVARDQLAPTTGGDRRAHVRSRKPAMGVGSQQEDVERLSAPRAPGMKAGTTAAPRVTATNTTVSTRARCRRRTACLRNWNRIATSSTARRGGRDERRVGDVGAIRRQSRRAR